MARKSLHPDDGFPVWQRLFVIDVHALAFLRIAAGLLVFAELINASGTFGFFYGTNGFLTIPLDQVFCPPGQGFWSLYWLVDSPWFVLTLMVLTGITSLGLAVGWRTREMVIITLVLFWSLNVRNPLVTTAGHVLLRMILFWMIFLPVGAVWSVDSIRKKSEQAAGNPKICNVATAALMLQVAMMYFFSGFAKWNEVWMRGEALEIALQLDMYVKPFGHWLAQFGSFTKSFTLLTVILELIGPFLLFLPYGNRWLRVFFLVAFCSMHVGIWLTMSIGIFSLVAVSSWVIFLPPDLWNRFGKSSGSATTEPGRLPIWATVICVLFLVNSVGMNLGNAGLLVPKQNFFRTVGNISMTTQEFLMFGRPSEDNIWFELRLGDGNEWETLRGPDRATENIADPEPRSVYQTENSQYWRRMLFNLATIQAQSDEERQWLQAVRKHLTLCWLAEARPFKEEELGGKIVQLQCWRRAIDLNAFQAARRELWAEVRLNQAQKKGD